MKITSRIIIALIIFVNALTFNVTAVSAPRYIFLDTLDNYNGSGWWDPRGVNVSADKVTGFKGGGEAAVGREETWNGLSKNLSVSDFVPGNSYSFGVWVTHLGEGKQKLQLTLQYNLDGTTEYAMVAQGSTENRAWILLENTEFAIPSGASSLVLYVEAPEDANLEFVIDEASGAETGVRNPYADVSESKGEDGGGILGDVDGDGIVNAADVILLTLHILDIPKGVVNEPNSDIIADGEIDVYDLAALKNTLIYNRREVTTTTMKTTATQTAYTEKTTTVPATTKAPATTAITTATAPQPARKDGIWYNTADISWIEPNKPMVAFTFDDGPFSGTNGQNAQRIQDALSKSQFHATFFYWGEHITNATESEIKRAYSLGFEIGNHTQTHQDLGNAPLATAQKEINDCAAALKRITGLDEFLIRPPYLSVGNNFQQAAKGANAPLINCGTDSQDWNGASAQQIIDTIKNKVSNGSLNGQIVLMHENYGATAEAVEYLLPYLKQQGWQVVGVSELFKAKGKEMTNGNVYTYCN